MANTEARAFTVAGLIVVAGGGVASVVSTDIEGFLDYWVILTLAAGVGGWTVWKIGRSIWLSADIEYELRRPLPDYPVTPPRRPVAQQEDVDA
jgi:hypothetical protein